MGDLLRRKNAPPQKGEHAKKRFFVQIGCYLGDIGFSFKPFSLRKQYASASAWNDECDNTPIDSLFRTPSQRRYDHSILLHSKNLQT